MDAPQRSKIPSNETHGESPPETDGSAMVNVKQLQPVMDFRGAYGRLCTLAAQAMKDGVSREAVRYALAGEGDYIALGPVRQARKMANMRGDIAAVALRSTGMTPTATTEALIAIAREAREAVESEWGESRDNGDDAIWDRLTLPMVNVR